MDRVGSGGMVGLLPCPLPFRPLPLPAPLPFLPLATNCFHWAMEYCLLPGIDLPPSPIPDAEPWWRSSRAQSLSSRRRALADDRCLRALRCQAGSCSAVVAAGPLKSPLKRLGIQPKFPGAPGRKLLIAVSKHKGCDNATLLV